MAATSQLKKDIHGNPIQAWGSFLTTDGIIRSPVMVNWLEKIKLKNPVWALEITISTTEDLTFSENDFESFDIIFAWASRVIPIAHLETIEFMGTVDGTSVYFSYTMIWA